MKNESISNEEISLLEYQIALYESRAEELSIKVAAYELHEENEKRLHEAIGKHLGMVVDKSNIDTIKLPRAVAGGIMDEIFGNKNDLIRPSHQVLQYSLIRKHPELEEYIPTQPGTSALALLNDKSTSRAYELVREFTAENTKRAYMGDLIYWQAWLSAAGFTFNESLTNKEIISFIIQHVEGLDQEVDQKLVDQRYKTKVGPHKLATIKRRIISLSIFLEGVKWSNPCQSKEVKQLLSKLTVKYGDSKPSGKAITKDILDDMVDTCKKTLLDTRDRALLLFAWGSGGRRRSEVVVANMSDLVKTPDGEFIYTIPQSKTDQEGKGSPVPIKGRVAKALQDWLNESGVTEGAIFRSVRKGSRLGGALNDNAVYRIVHNRLARAGYDETQFCAHSLRSGFVTEAGRRNKPLGDVMALTTHKNVNTVMKYYQAGNIINNSASNLAD